MRIYGFILFYYTYFLFCLIRFKNRFIYTFFKVYYIILNSKKFQLNNENLKYPKHLYTFRINVVDKK